MADEQGKPIAPALPFIRAAGDRAAPPTAENDGAPKNCLACGAYHGSVNVARHCLEREVMALRRQLRLAGDERRLVAEAVELQEGADLVFTVRGVAFACADAQIQLRKLTEKKP